MLFLRAQTSPFIIPTSHKSQSTGKNLSPNRP